MDKIIACEKGCKFIFCSRNKCLMEFQSV